jgi:membrane protein DedA with SNARE-associated domain
MPTVLMDFISNYGYLSIFFLVFIQEIGIPTFPNEVLLMYAGYIAFAGTLNIFWVICVALSADISGTFLLYIIFIIWGDYLYQLMLKRLPRSLPLLAFVKRRVQQKGKAGVLIGRLIPYVRGYTSVVAGLFKMNVKEYSSMILLSAIIWTGGYILLGWFCGSYCKTIFGNIFLIKDLIIIIPVSVLLIYGIRLMIKKTVLNKSI